MTHTWNLRRHGRALGSCLDEPGPRPATCCLHMLLSVNATCTVSHEKTVVALTCLVPSLCSKTINASRTCLRKASCLGFGAAIDHASLQLVALVSNFSDELRLTKLLLQHGTSYYGMSSRPVVLIRGGQANVPLCKLATSAI